MSELSRIEILEAMALHRSEKMFNFFSESATNTIDGQPVQAPGHTNKCPDVRKPCPPTAGYPFIDQTWHELKLVMDELKRLKEEN